MPQDADPTALLRWIQDKTVVALTVAGLAVVLVAVLLLNIAMGTFRPDHADLVPPPDAVTFRVGDELAVWLSTSAEAVTLRLDSRDIGVAEIIERNPLNGVAVVLGAGLGCLDAVVSGLEVASVTDADATVTLTLDKELGVTTSVVYRYYEVGEPPPASSTATVVGDEIDITLSGLATSTAYAVEASTNLHFPASITRALSFTSGDPDSGTVDQRVQQVPFLSATGVRLIACRESEDVAITLHGDEGELNAFLVDVVPAETVNRPPVFVEGAYASRRVCVDRVGRSTATTTIDYLSSGESVGGAVTATDGDFDTVSYALGVDDPHDHYLFFDVDSSGQITVNPGGAIDENGLAFDGVYPVLLSAFDGNGGLDTIIISIQLDANVLASAGNGVCP